MGSIVCIRGRAPIIGLDSGTSGKGNDSLVDSSLGPQSIASIVSVVGLGGAIRILVVFSRILPVRPEKALLGCLRAFEGSATEVTSGSKSSKSDEGSNPIGSERICASLSAYMPTL